MKNRIFKLFLVLIVLFTFTGCGKDKEKETVKEPEVKINNNDAIIWEVKSDTATVYLVGSIHVARDETYPLQQVLLDAFADSDALAVEANIVDAMADEELLAEMSALMTYTDGTTARDHLSDETAKMLDDYIAKYGISGMGTESAELIYLFKPWAIQSFIESDIVLKAGLDANLGIDMYFINEAKKRNMEIIEVESIMFQYNLFDNYSPELQDLLLRSSLETTPEESCEELLKMLEAWEKGDIVKLGEMVLAEDDDLTDAELKLYEEYNKALMTDRNVAMADKVEELLKGDKNVFYVVGSAHYVGADGIVNLLMNRGYTIVKK